MACLGVVASWLRTCPAARERAAATALLLLFVVSVGPRSVPAADRAVPAVSITVAAVPGTSAVLRLPPAGEGLQCWLDQRRPLPWRNVRQRGLPQPRAPTAS